MSSTCTMSLGSDGLLKVQWAILDDAKNWGSVPCKAALLVYPFSLDSTRPTVRPLGTSNLGETSFHSWYFYDRQLYFCPANQLCGVMPLVVGFVAPQSPTTTEIQWPWPHVCWIIWICDISTICTMCAASIKHWILPHLCPCKYCVHAPLHAILGCLPPYMDLHI